MEGRRSRFEEVTVKISKKDFKLINAVCGGDERKINKLIRYLISESLKNKTTDELLKVVEPSRRRRKQE
ncbi:hypothetical protein TST_0275 [Thermosulfidibacter takaii ABI70S6]|uniref:CopG family transcriptional regulator n=1 Tax=Thermosulfidibacter takaii (strain DSM 17441 / JCM 13301 / NBRC 103674 / ABI70S6) TaxID=1298851 RepID=A0A0S3QRY6_THET7|nr:hypothetical protein [Thermosulfidibacter takaii]BAT71084.1 hypothetical protein TST_0275 [Thermosulfidibacter takaii ABI70S6]